MLPRLARPWYLIAGRDSGHTGSRRAGRVAMLDVQVTWLEAAVTSAGVLALALLATLAGWRRAGPRHAGAAKIAQEAGLLLGLYALWQLAGTVSATSPQSAVDRAGWIWHLERVIGLPGEAA